MQLAAAMDDPTIGPYAPERWRVERLPMLAPLAPLLPGGPDKRPMVGNAWQQHPGLTVTELQQEAPSCVCWHIGADPGHIAVDIDGPAASALCIAHGCDPATVDTWRIVRTSNKDRLKLVFKVTPDQKATLSAAAKTVKVDGQELAVFASPGTQIVVLGDHYTKESHYTEHDDQYAWAGRLPAEAKPIPPEWMALLVGIFAGERPLKPPTARQTTYPAFKPPSRNGAGGGRWVNSSQRQPCPICGRDHSGACSIAGDGNSAWCCHGETRSAPDCSTAGQTIKGTDGRMWGYVRTEEHDSFGERSLFVLDQPREAASRPPGTKPPRTAAQPAEAPAEASQEEPDDDASDAAAALALAGRVDLALADVLPDSIAEPLTRLAAAYPADPLALLLPLLTLTASIVGNRCRVKVKETWDEPFLLWGMNLAGASSGKSPMAEYLIRPATRWAISLKDQHKQETVAWLRDKQLAMEEAVDKKAAAVEWPIENPPPPPGRELFVMDATLEKIGSILNGERTVGLVSFHDELSTWFAQHQRSGKGGPDHRSNWNSLWNGRTLKVDRQNGESFLVANTAVSVFGSSTLALHEAQSKATLKANHDIPDPDGMQARFLVCLPQAITWQFNPIEVATTDLLLNLYKAIDAAVPACPDPAKPTMITFEPDAWPIVEAMANDMARTADSSGPAKAQWLGKMRGNLVRIAGVLHVLDRALKGLPLTDPIGKETADRAVMMALWQCAQFAQLQASTGGETAGLSEGAARLIVRGAAWRKRHGDRPATMNQIRDWGIPTRTCSSAERTEWLRQTVASAPGLGKIVEQGKGLAWLPPP
jgi:hypothetical protein